MDLGENIATGPGRLDKLITAIEGVVLNYKEDEARDVFHAGSRPDGPLPRQVGEPMTGYIARRKRWKARRSPLDTATKVSDIILADYLLDNSGLTSQERLLIRTAVGNKTSFQEIAAAIRRQRPEIHLRERRAKDQGDPGGDRAVPRAFRSWKTHGPKPATGFRRPFHRKAYLANKSGYDQREYEDEDDHADDSHSDADVEPYQRYTCAGEGECDSIEDQLEQDIVAYFMAAGADMGDTNAAEECATCYSSLF